MPTDPIDIYVGQRLRQVRRERGQSLQTVAGAIGVSYQQLQKYENAANRVSASQLWRLAAYLGVNVASLFPNAGHANPDLKLVGRLRHLPPDIRSVIGDLAEAIVAAERQALSSSGPLSSDPT